jgi:Ni,Fe-hydrogenase I large subunit
MAIEGELVVTIRWNGRAVEDVAVRSTRPDAVQRLLRGRRPGDAVQLVTRLFSICGSAQGAAAATALEAAQGASAPASVRAARSAAIRLETAQEHCQRIGIDWAQAVGAPPLVAFVRGVREALGRPSATLLDHGLHDGPPLDVERTLREPLLAIRPAAERTLLGMSTERWLEQTHPDDLDRWIATDAAPACWYATLQDRHAGLGASDVALMPAVDADSIRAAVLPAWHADESFGARPAWRGAAVETGALARMAAHPLVAALLAQQGNTIAVRLVARLTELALLLTDDATRACGHGDVIALAQDGNGYAVTQTARGVLLHRAAVAGGAVRAYAIVAPTEWNFRPDGSYAHALERIEGDDATAIERDARLVAQAVDPCVACRVEVAHA